MCKITYGVPVYNAEKTLLRCVESLVYGDEKDIEIVLVEDGSQDHSWEECLRLQQQFPHIVCIQNDGNRGVSYTRNQVLKVAKGDYILFVDSDDWVSYEYGSKLTATAQEYPRDLTICGFRFFENVAGYRQDYIWEPGGQERYILDKRDFFMLVEKVLIQSPCNKAFRREVIEQAHIRFDETQSMGEDFEFVLAYMQAIECQRCVVLNEPLYSYIRANNSSLMSNFGLVENDDEYQRLKTLLEIAGADDEVVCNQYDRAVEALRNNYVYHAMRSKQFGTAEKKAFIMQLVGENDAKREYIRHKKIMRKEAIVELVGKSKHILNRLCGRWQREKNIWQIKKIRKTVVADHVTIFSQNCIGGVFYHDMGMPFLSPTVNLYFDAPDFVRFASDPKQYLEKPVQMKWGLDYPIGILDDVTIHFMHYSTCEEANGAWERRKKRVDYDNVVVVSTDRNGFTEDVFEKWKNIPYAKVLFTSNPLFADVIGSIYYPKYRQEGCVPDLIPKREFYKDGVLIESVRKRS